MHDGWSVAQSVESVPEPSQTSATPHSRPEDPQPSRRNDALDGEVRA